MKIVMFILGSTSTTGGLMGKRGGAEMLFSIETTAEPTHLNCDKHPPAAFEVEARLVGGSCTPC